MILRRTASLARMRKAASLTPQFESPQRSFQRKSFWDPRIPDATDHLRSIFMPVGPDQGQHASVYGDLLIYLFLRKPRPVDYIRVVGALTGITIHEGSLFLSATGRYEWFHTPNQHIEFNQLTYPRCQ